MMIDFHIGAPRIGAGLLHAVTAAPTLRTYPDLFVLPQASYRDTFRTLVNTRNSTPSKEGDWHDAKRQIGSLTQYDTVAISQHAALGTPNNIISSPRGLARAEARTAALSSLFKGHPLTFHFMITSQVEYLTTTLGSGARAAIAAGTTLSRFDLVAQLKAAAPERPFAVWDFERPRDVALAFVAEMLGTSDSGFIDEARQLIKQNHSYQDHINTPQDLGGPEDSLTRLDDQYEADLNLIAEMEGVSLIGSGTVSKNLRL